MAKETSRNIRLGIIVFTGIVFLVAALYFIGDKRNLFGSNFKISANFSNVNGLTEGNNVRYVGIDIGTVSGIMIINDSTVLVEMTIESEALKFIKKNAIASIGTDGLMGNKLVNIRSGGNGGSNYIQEGDILATIAPLETEDIMRTLSKTNDEMLQIATNLKSITDKINDENNFWNLLKDTTISNNIRHTLANVEMTSYDVKDVARSFKLMMNDVKAGKGMAGALLKDNNHKERLEKTFSNIEDFSDTLAQLSNEISSITRHVNKGQGAAGTILKDEKFEKDLVETLENIKRASKGLEDNMEALKHNFLFRRYYKKLKSEQ
jgi:phospholipid/cholesterol/gamma-HCH transport system substrate-binding protein